MIASGIELAQLHERRTADGSIALVGFLGGAMIAVAPDPARPGTWRVTIHDPADGSRQDHAMRALTISAHADLADDFDDQDVDIEDDGLMDDSIPEHWGALQLDSGGR